MKQRIFIDMDGTLAEFKVVDELEKLYEKGYFYNLKPHINLIKAIKQIIEKYKGVEVYILSSVLTDSEYALIEKNNWLDKYLPEIDLEHRIFPPCGKNKAKYIPDGVMSNDILIDDYTKNLVLWQPPAKALKMINEINHKRGIWSDDTISYKDKYEDIATDIIEYAQKEVDIVLTNETVKIRLALKLSDEIDEYMFKDNQYKYWDLIGDSDIERKMHKKKIYTELINGNIECYKEIIENYEPESILNEEKNIIKEDINLLTELYKVKYSKTINKNEDMEVNVHGINR